MTGWRIGYVCAPAGLMAGIAKIHQYGIMCASDAPPSTPPSRRYAAGSRSCSPCTPSTSGAGVLMTRRFNEMGLTCFEPMGAFDRFPNVRDATGLDDEQFAQELLREEHVAVVPGSAFGPSGAGHVRACYAASYEEIVEAMDRTQRFVERRRSAAASA